MAVNDLADLVFADQMDLALPRLIRTPTVDISCASAFSLGGIR